MCSGKDIVLAVDYHDENLVIRRLDCATGQEEVLKRPTSREAIAALVASASRQAQPSGGQAVWIMESTTGWARVKRIVEPQARFVLANVVQMPLPPKARRKKTDKVDTKRLLREYLNGQLPRSFTPDRRLRQVRRLTALRESLVSRRTALRNWINRYLAHETWCVRKGLWSNRGRAQLQAFAASLEGLDAVTWSVKLGELDHVGKLIRAVEKEIRRVYRCWPEAQWLAEVPGIAEVAAVSILARIGPIERFGSAEELIAFAGLAPGVQQSDGHVRSGKLGGGATDKHLRHYVIEASLWARTVPRYAGTYERVRGRRGKKVARLVVARLLLRSIYKMLRDGVRFSASRAGRSAVTV